MQRVAIIAGGCELARKLAAHYQTVWVPEFARHYLDAKNAARPLADITPADIGEIARGQIRSEEELARQANQLLICDTELLTTQLWSEHFFGACDQREIDEPIIAGRSPLRADRTGEAQEDDRRADGCKDEASHAAILPRSAGGAKRGGYPPPPPAP